MTTTIRTTFLTLGLLAMLILPVQPTHALSVNQALDSGFLFQQLAVMQSTASEAELQEFLILMIALLQQAVLQGGGNHGGGNSNDGNIETFEVDDIESDEAELSGEPNFGDDWEVWFAIDDDDTTPSCHSSSQREKVSGRYDKGENFYKVVDDLDEDTKYYFRACGEDEDGEVYSGDIETFRTDDDNDDDGDDEIKTVSATNIKDDEAKLRGEIQDGGDDWTVWFVLDDDDKTPDCDDTKIDHKVSGKQDEGDDFSKTVDDLDEDTKYYFRACGEDDDGDEYEGEVKSFRTDEDGSSSGDDVEVTTLYVIDVEEDEATLVGRVAEGDNVKVWFAIDDNDSTPSCTSSSHKESVSGSKDEGEEFTKTVDDLDKDEKYYFRACAEDEDDDVISGKVYVFYTEQDEDDDDAEVTTEEADDITDDSVELNADLDIGDVDEVEVWFEWGEDEDELTEDTDSDEVDNNASFRADIDGLEDDTRYYYRAMAMDTDTKEVFRGEVEEFETDD